MFFAIRPRTPPVLPFCRSIRSNKAPAISLADENTAERPEAIRAWHEISEWVQAAAVKRTLQHSRFGFLGNSYNGMRDMYSDFTMMQAQAGIQVEVLEMCDLDKFLPEVTDAEVAQKLTETKAMFEISEDSPTDPIAKKPTPEQLEWSCKVALAQEKMVRVYHCFGEGDLKTALAMKI